MPAPKLEPTPPGCAWMILGAWLFAVTVAAFFTAMEIIDGMGW